MDEHDEEHPEGPLEEEPVTERVRIVGAETASVLAAQSGAAQSGAAQSGAAQSGAEPAAANGQSAPEEEREQHYLGFVHDVAPSPPAPGPVVPPADPSALAAIPPELPHWSDPPTGQVPAIIDRRADEPEDPFADSGPVWREHDHEWEDAGFDHALLRDEGEAPGGALDETPSEERRPWEFDDLAPAAAGPAAVAEQGTLDWDDVVAGEAAELDTGRIDAGAVADAGWTPAGESWPPVPAGEEDDEESITGQHRAVVSSWWDDQAAGAEAAGAEAAGPAEGAGDSDAPGVTSVLPVEEPTRQVAASSLEGTVAAQAGSGEAFFDAPAAEEGAGAEPVAPRRHRRPPGTEPAGRPAVRVPAAAPGAGRRNVPVAIATGIVVAALALLCFWAGTVATLVLATVVVTLAAAEAYAALRRSGRRPATLLGLVATVAVMVTAYTRGVAALPLVTMLVVVTAMVWYLVGADRSSAVEGISGTVLGFMWVGILGSFSALMLAPSIYPHRHGVAFLLGAVVATVAQDVGALAVGSVLGRHQLAPHVSPNKTWEGWVGGAVLAVVASVVVTGQVHPWTPAKAAILGIVIAVVGPVGDLCESLVKRDLGLKDMGSLLPGHGGVLDRVDALLFALPATYYLVRLLNLG